MNETGATPSETKPSAGRKPLLPPAPATPADAATEKTPCSTEEFEALWKAAASALDGSPPDEQAYLARIALWQRQEWHGWFRWRLCRKGMDWSKPLWLGSLGAGVGALVWCGLHSGRWDLTAGGVVAWFTLVNLGFFSYLGLHTPRPPRPLPGPFCGAPTVRAEMGLFPPGYDGRASPRIWLRVPRLQKKDVKADTQDPPETWWLELTFPEGLPKALAERARRQQTFRMQRGGAPLMRAVCEVRPVTRARIDLGAHPLKVLAWDWDERGATPFERPRG